MQIVAAGMTSVDGAPSAIVYLPKGSHTINATVDGVPSAIDVTIDEQVAQTLQQSLEARQANNVRPIIDFDHQDTGPAAGLPKRFYWDDEEGVMLEVDWTGSGKAAVEARDYSYFSPLFLIDDEGRPTGLHEQRPVGGLVNDPAFRSIRRIAAAHAEPETIKTMQNDFTRLVECGALDAKQAKGDGAVDAIAEAFLSLQKENQTLEARATEAEKERDEARATIEAQREAEVEKVIAKAVEAGRISKKDEDAQAFWKSAILEKGEAAVKQLEALGAPSKGSIDQPVIQAGHREGNPNASGDNAKEVAARAAKIRNRATEIQAERKIPFTQAWGLASKEIPTT